MDFDTFAHGVFCVGCGDEFAEGCLGVVVDGARHDFGGGVFVLKADDAVTVGFFEEVKLGVCGIHAEGVVVGFEEVTDHSADELEVEDHLSVVETVGFEDELDFAGVPVREAALVRVLGE